LATKKIGVIRNWISNYIQSGIIDAIVHCFNVPMPIRNAIYLATNLDQLAIVQWSIGQLGLYKWAAYCIYFLFLA
jgi:hypothetical protein